MIDTAALLSGTEVEDQRNYAVLLTQTSGWWWYYLV